MTLSKLLTQSVKQKSMWTKRWIILHCFHTKLQWPHLPKSMDSFSHPFSNICKTLYICSIFLLKHIQNSMRANLAYSAVTTLNIWKVFAQAPLLIFVWNVCWLYVDPWQQFHVASKTLQLYHHYNLNRSTPVKCTFKKIKHD